jgi:transposase-like protein
MEYTLPKEGKMAKQQKTYTREFKVEAVQLVKRNGTSPAAYFILHKSKQSARSMSTGVELPGKTAPHLVYVD